MNEARLAGSLVALLVGLYVHSLATDRNRAHPGQHVLLVIGGSLAVVPYVFLTSPAWYGLPMQLTANVLVLALDWFSFHEDKTRFSEADLCLTGPCRRNAAITGHLAHWGDVLGVALLLMTHVEAPEERRVVWPAIVAGALAYGAAGSRLVHRVTRDGSVSDLRGKTEAEKCAQARIMRDGWRGGLNDLITVLGIVVLWQALFTCGDGRCRGPLAPMKVVRATVTDAAREGDVLSWMRLALTVLSTVVPTYSNYVNTAAQHGRLPAATYGLPACFDD